MKLISLISIIVFSTVGAQSFSVARVHYGGGGDWYSDPSSIPNLLTYLEENTPVSTVNKDTHLKLTDKEINQYPYLYITGHGNIRLTENEVISLRSILMNNGFLHADDNYGHNYHLHVKTHYSLRYFEVILPHSQLTLYSHDR